MRISDNTMRICKIMTSFQLTMRPISIHRPICRPEGPQAFVGRRRLFTSSFVHILPSVFTFLWAGPAPGLRPWLLQGNALFNNITSGCVLILYVCCFYWEIRINVLRDDFRSDISNCISVIHPRKVFPLSAIILSN